MPDTSVLRQATQLAVTLMPDCVSSSVVRWREGEPEAAAASHPDAGALLDVQFATGQGPLLTALASGRAVDSPDLARDDRWPRFAAAALARGIRAARTLVATDQGGTLLLTGYATAPRAFGPRDSAAGAVLLAQLGTLLSTEQARSEAERDAYQAREMVLSRSVIDQAKGVLVHARMCDPETAFEALRRLSQSANVRLADIAAWLVEHPREVAMLPPRMAGDRQG